jgi:hypothetical protein
VFAALQRIVPPAPRRGKSIKPNLSVADHLSAFCSA